jgi:acetyl esterase/lipase
VERLINRLKQYRRIATRYEKRAGHYLATLALAAALLWLRVRKIRTFAIRRAADAPASLPTRSAPMAPPIRRFWRVAVVAPLLALSVRCSRRTAVPQDAAVSAGRLMTPQELQTLPYNAPDQRLAYGEDSSQYGELRVPAGRGPHPVVVLIHGGCFKAAYATARDLAPMGDALKADGIASWNVEYRRLGQPGGGWPGTYLDVGRALDHLRTLAGQYDLDVGRVVVAGHSAGGHLAMWAAARLRLAATSPLYVANPLPVRGVIDLAGPVDMTANIRGYETLCRDTVITSLLGGTPAAVPAHYAQASAIKLLPLGVPQVLVVGAHEEFVPLPLAEAYAQAALRAGDPVRLIVIPGVGHFEIASPRASTWPQVESAIGSLLDGTLPPETAPAAAKRPR